MVDVLDWAEQRRGSYQEVKLPKPGSLKQLDADGYAAFSLAPVANYVPDIDDRRLFGRFAGEPNAAKPGEIRVAAFELSYPAVANCGMHGLRLHCMDKPSYAWFKQWMLAQGFLDPFHENYYTVRARGCPVMDPFVHMSNKGPDVGTSLEVFAVSSMRGNMVPRRVNLPGHDAAPMYITFTREEPDPEVVKIGLVLLEQRRKK